MSAQALDLTEIQVSGSLFAVIALGAVEEVVHIVMLPLLRTWFEARPRSGRLGLPVDVMAFPALVDHRAVGSEGFLAAYAHVAVAGRETTLRY